MQTIQEADSKTGIYFDEVGTLLLYLMKWKVQEAESKTEIYFDEVGTYYFI
jgi:hypothetical protein